VLSYQSIPEDFAGLMVFCDPKILPDRIPGFEQDEARLIYAGTQT
jgi:hypothetical protein